MRAFDAYEFERLAVPRAADNDFVLVNLFREPIGAAMPPDAINTLITAAGRRAGFAPTVRPHQLRHAFASNLADAGGGLDEIADLLGHASLLSSQVYLHPDPGWLRAAIDVSPALARPRRCRGDRAVGDRVGGAARAARIYGPGRDHGRRRGGRGMSWVLAALIDPGFLAGAGWDTASRVLSVPPGHPLLGWSVCQTARCTNQVYGCHRTCGACRAGQDDPLADDTGVAEPA